jgi:ABC-type transport system involved in multi-copper enzyme maturation permease subunit
MDDMVPESENSTGSVIGKIIVLIIFLFIWLVVGGLSTLAPIIAVNPNMPIAQVLYLALIFVGLLPITFSLWLFSTADSSKYPFIFNFFIWLALVIFLWGNGPK